MNIQERDTILVPTDFTDVSEFAIDHAVEIAKICKHKICLLHVVSKRSLGSERVMILKENLENQAEAISRRTGLSVFGLLEDGSIFTTISEVASRILAEFIVMGIHGKKGVQHLVGSYAYKVVRSMNIPVFVVKHMHHHVGYKNIVLPVDFSRKRAHKVAQAVKFARYFGATVRVFGFLSSSNKAKIIKKEALLKGVTDIFKKHDIEVTTQLLVNPGIDWAEALMKYAEDIDADLIMMVADKAGRMPEFFYSNATERIIDKADVPILTVAPLVEIKEDDAQKKAFLRPFVDPLGLLGHDNLQIDDDQE
jgi:nucleotide-binding universal stress UspA family protein